MPLVFEVAISIAAISQIASIGVSGQMEWEMKQVGSPRPVKVKHSDTNNSAVPSISDLHWHNSQGRPGLLLKAVWHPMQSN